MKVLRVVGKLMISIGVGILLFVAWTLWGTGILAEHEQNKLADEFAALPSIEPVITAARPGDESTVLEYAGPPKTFRPAPGDAVFRMGIPAIWGKPKMIVEGVGTEELHSGPGHYPECGSSFVKPLCTEFEAQWPGEKGRVVVSGHRTTWGQPFWDLNRVKPGDEVLVETQWGDFTYVVTELAVVPPDSLSIIVDTNKAELVLTTCNPRFSASERLIVYAELTEAEVAEL